MKRPLLGVCICLFIVIALMEQFVNPPPWKCDNTSWEGKTVTLIGQVYKKEYRISFGEERLIIYLKSCFYSKEANASYQQIKKASNKLSEINPIENIICEINISELPQGQFVPELGNNVLVRGIWQSFEHATNPGEFDAANYYAIEGIGAKIQRAELLAADKSNWPLREVLYKCRRQFLKNLYYAFPQNEAAILAKMLLGDGSGLDKEIKNLYQSNGIVHILSISGLHITMLGMGLYRVLRKLWLPIIPSAIWGGIGILLYGCMTGFEVSACRAIGMYLIHMLGEIWGKTYDMLTAMGVLGIIMLLENPMLSYHSGFLLSFTSVCGVGMLAPLFQLPQEWFCDSIDSRNHVWKRKGKLFLRKLTDSIAVSVAVTIFTLPIQLFFFYKIPLYSLFINLLIIPFMSALMVTGILVMLFPILKILTYVGVGILDWFEWLCLQFEKLPGHTWVVGEPPIWKIIVYYLLLTGILLMDRKVKRYMKLAVLGLAIFFLVFSDQSGLKITMLDVGQGDCICVQTSNGQCYLFDGGSSSHQNIAEKVILPFLHQQGISHIEGIFLSHADADHSNGLLQLIEQELIPVKTLYLPSIENETNKNFADILESFGKIRIQYIQKGDSWQLGDLKCICLHPYKKFEGNSNACSGCFLLEKEEFSMLFTGDVEGEGESLLLQELQKRINQVDVLKVAHHGSRYSTTEEFLSYIKPKVALISCGESNSYGHPHKETLERLECINTKIWKTMDCGAIQLYETTKGIQMRTYNIDFKGQLKYY